LRSADEKTFFFFAELIFSIPHSSFNFKKEAVEFYLESLKTATGVDNLFRFAGAAASGVGTAFQEFLEKTACVISPADRADPPRLRKAIRSRKRQQPLSLVRGNGKRMGTDTAA
jgi:hypothetical protein